MAVNIQNIRNIPQAKKEVKKAMLFICGVQGENSVSTKTQTPCPGLSLALWTTSEKDLFPSAILKEMNARRDAGLLLI